MNLTIKEIWPLQYSLRTHSYCQCKAYLDKMLNSLFTKKISFGAMETKGLSIAKIGSEGL